MNDLYPYRFSAVFLGMLLLSNVMANVVRATVAIAPQESVTLALQSPDALARELFDQVLAEINQLDDTTEWGETGAVEPNAQKVHWLSNVAQRMGTAGRPDWAEPVFDQALALTEPDYPVDLYLDQSIDRLRMDVLLKMAQGNLSDRALTLAPTVKTDFFRAQLFNAIATVQLEAGNPTAARPLVMEALQLTRSVADYSFAYEANGSCLNEKFVLLVQIADNLSRLDNFSEALATSGEVRSCYAASHPFGPFEAYQAQIFTVMLAQVDSTAELDPLWQASLLMSDPIEQHYVWEAIAVKYLQQGNLEQVLTIAEQILKASIPDEPWLAQNRWRQRFQALSVLSQQAWQAGQPTTAQHLDSFKQSILQKLQQVEQDNPDLLPTVNPTTNRAAQAVILAEGKGAIAQAEYWQRQGQTQHAIAILTQAWDLVANSGHGSVATTRQALITAMADLGEQEQAIAWADILPGNARLLTLFDLQVKDYDVAQILATMRQLPEPEAQLSLLYRLTANDLRTLPQLDKVRAVWQAQQSTWPQWQHEPFQAFLSQAYIELGAVEQGLAVVGESRTAMVVQGVVEALIQQAEYEQALIWVAYLEDAYDNPFYTNALQELAVGLLQSNGQ